MHRYTYSGLAVLLGAVVSSAVVDGQVPAPAPTTTARPPLQVPATKPVVPTTDAGAQSPISVEEIRKALGSPTTVTATVSAIDYNDRVVVLNIPRIAPELVRTRPAATPPSAAPRRKVTG